MTSSNRREAHQWLPMLHEIADRADAIALSMFRKRSLRVEEKPDSSPVSEADQAIEAGARAIIGERTPELGVFGEEQGDSPGSCESRLIIDPIDATRNFIRGIPFFATLLAIEVAGEVVAGVVSAAALGQRWSAARGAGAFEGERRLTVSRIRRLEGAQVFHGDLTGSAEEHPSGPMVGVLRLAARARGFGDFYQHVLVAEGAGELSVDPAVQPWDIAALQVIVEEAGGQATTLAGERTIYGGSLLTTNGLVHDQAVALLTSAV